MNLRKSITLCVVYSAIAAGAFAQSNPNGVIPLNTMNEPYLFLVRDQVVHADLKLSAKQQKQLDAVNDKTGKALWSMRNQGPEHREETTKKADEYTRKKLTQILTPTQNERINQIELRVLGMRSLFRDSLAEKMKLKPQQQVEIEKIVTSAQKKTYELKQQLSDGGDKEELNEQFRKTQLDQQKKIVALISEDQKKIWVTALGSKIDTTKLGKARLKAPELIEDSGWVNSEPLTLEKLKGKVVALHFYAFA